MQDLRVAFANHMNHVDHLAPVCSLVGAPLVVPDPRMAAIVRRCYPELEVRFAAEDVAYEMFRDARVFLHSERIARQQVTVPRFRRARFVCCPHGWSDKAWWLKWMALEDVFLAYGPATLQMMADEGTLPFVHRYVMSGDLRYAYYLRNRDRLDEIVREALHGLAPGNRTALYAPTWNDPEDASTLARSLEPLIETLPDGWNIVFRLHSFTTPEAKAHVLDAISRRPGRAVIAPDHPLVYPFLAAADVYIGDRSSVGYSYLHFDRPIVVLRSERQALSVHDLLGRCAVEVSLSDISRLWSNIESDDLAEARAEVRQAVYSPTLDEDAFRAALDLACTGDITADHVAVPAEFRAQQTQLMPIIPPTSESIFALRGRLSLFAALDR